MPVNLKEFLDGVSILADNHNMRATVQSSGKGALICGACCFVGGILGGPVGLAAGGTIGGITAYRMSGSKCTLEMFVCSWCNCDHFSWNHVHGWRDAITINYDRIYLYKKISGLYIIFHQNYFLELTKKYSISSQTSDQLAKSSETIWLWPSKNDWRNTLWIRCERFIPRTWLSFCPSSWTLAHCSRLFWKLFTHLLPMKCKCILPVRDVSSIIMLISASVLISL